LHQGMSSSGIDIIYPYLEHPDDPVLVLCDQETDGGGWTVIQNRYDGSEDFYRSWDEYVTGFGNPNEEHYLGNDVISQLTGQKVNELRVEIENWDNKSTYAHYQMFWVQLGYNYMLQVALYDGTAGNGFSVNDYGQFFSTFDHDMDPSSQNCAEDYHGGWWYGAYCGFSNLNGRYYPNGDAGDAEDGMTWGDDRHHVLKTSTMKIRPYCA
ncbi:unnamed protein product, partial [Meganyctiphanes norvegica]